MKHELAQLIASLKEAQELVIYVEGRDYHPREYTDHDWEDLLMMEKYGRRRPELLDVAKQMIEIAFNDFESSIDSNHSAMNIEYNSALETLIIRFANKRGWEVVHGTRGSTGAYWIKDGRFRMVSIEPKAYGWLIGLGNLLFVNLEHPETCILKRPSGEYRKDIHKRTKNFWRVFREKDLLDFLQQ